MCEKTRPWRSATPQFVSGTLLVHGNVHAIRQHSSASLLDMQAVEWAALPEGEPARERYLTFSRAGGSVDPTVGLRKAGIDMTGPAPIERALALMSSYIDRLEELAP